MSENDNASAEHGKINGADAYAGVTDYTVKSNDVGLTIPGNISDGVKVSYEKNSVTLIPGGTLAYACFDAAAESAVYKNAYGDGVSLKYTHLLSGVKEDIILSSYTSVNSFVFTLVTNGMSVYSENGKYYISESRNAKARFCLGDIVVYDARGRQSLGSMAVRTVEAGQRYILTIEADNGFLTDAETVVPLITKANDLIDEVYVKALGVDIQRDYSKSKYNGAIADQCSQGVNSSCDDCGEPCSEKHHKNIISMSDQLYNANRELNHIYVIWSDRDEDAYCKSETEEHESVEAMAVVYSHRPVINILTVAGNTLEEKEAYLRRCLQQLFYPAA